MLYKKYVSSLYDQNDDTNPAQTLKNLKDMYHTFLTRMMMQANSSTNITKQGLLMFVLGLPQEELKMVCICRSYH